MAPGEYGPKMARLTEKQRNYIKAMASAPFATPRSGSDGGVFGQASRRRRYGVAAAHDPRIEAAALEYAAHMMHRDGPVLAVSVMMEIARNKEHPQRLAAAEAIADRIGLHRLSEHKIVVEHQSTEAMVARIRELAAKLGMDAEELLGANMKDVTPPKLIEGRADNISRPRPRAVPTAGEAYGKHCAAGHRPDRAQRGAVGCAAPAAR